jgi:octaprenyl-diphosphate synthase
MTATAPTPRLLDARAFPARFDARDRAFWDRTLGEHNQHESDFAHAVHLIRSSGAAERTLETARIEVAAAHAALARAARGHFHDELAGLADYCVNRAY